MCNVIICKNVTVGLFHVKHLFKSKGLDLHKVFVLQVDSTYNESFYKDVQHISCMFNYTCLHTGNVLPVGYKKIETREALMFLKVGAGWSVQLPCATDTTY